MQERGEGGRDRLVVLKRKRIFLGSVSAQFGIRRAEQEDCLAAYWDTTALSLLVDMNRVEVQVTDSWDLKSLGCPKQSYPMQQGYRVLGSVRKCSSCPARYGGIYL